MGAKPYDSVLLVSYGGPDGPDDVIPFLEDILRGRNLSREKLEELAEPYMFFDGISPINEQNRALLAAVINELGGMRHDQPNLDGSNLGLAVYWANLHWHPFLADVLRQIADDGFSRTLAFVTSAYGSYPGCRQYRQAIERAREPLGAEAPRVDKIRLFYNHPGFIEAMTDRVIDAFLRIDKPRRADAKVLFTAHSLPVSMAKTSPYERQIRESCRLVVERLHACEQLQDDCKRSLDGWELVYQSRSGPPSQPWLGSVMGEWDVGEWLVAHDDCKEVLIVPIGFLSDHMEVIFDLDVEVQALCDHLGITLTRAGTVGTHPRFVRMIRELVEERLQPNPTRLSLGPHGPWPDECPADCCPGPGSPDGNEN